VTDATEEAVVGPRMVALGTVALDSVETPAGAAQEVAGGSALYFAAAAAPWGRVELVGVMGEDGPDDVLHRLEDLGVDARGIRQVAGPTFRWRVRYDASGRRETLEARRGRSVRTAPEPDANHAGPDALFLGSTAPGVQQAVLEAVAPAGVVVLDSMRHWIDDPEERAVLEALLPRVDLLLTSEEELDAWVGPQGEGEPEGEARTVAWLQARGVEAVVVKAGARGARIYRRQGSEPSRVPAQPVPRTVDPTGAGDAMAGGLVGVLAARVAGGGSWQAGLDEAVREGVRTGAVAVRAFSVEALLELASAGATVPLEGEG